MFLDGSERVIRATVNGEVEVIDVKNGDVEYSFNVARRVLWACSLSPCKERILIPGKESTVEIRVLESGSLLRRLIGLKAGVTTCHWHPGGNYVAASDEQLLAIWRADRSRPILTVELPEIGLNTCQWSQSGIAIAVGEDSGHVTIFDSTDGSILTRFVAHNGRIFSCAWSFDDGRLLTAGEDGVVRIWDTVSSSCVGELVGHEGRVLDARWSPDASQAISVADDGSMRLWEIGAGCCSRVHAVSSAGHAVWKPDAQHVLELDGDAWEYLGWNSIREGIGMDRVPVE
jgi:WD40 repeat protein